MEVSTETATLSHLARREIVVDVRDVDSFLSICICRLIRDEIMLPRILNREMEVSHRTEMRSYLSNFLIFF